jgi:hypothetical protein
MLESTSGALIACDLPSPIFIAQLPFAVFDLLYIYGGGFHQDFYSGIPTVCIAFVFENVSVA